MNIQLINISLFRFKWAGFFKLSDILFNIYTFFFRNVSKNIYQNVATKLKPLKYVLSVVKYALKIMNYTMCFILY